MAPADIVFLAVVGLACLRGLAIGLAREVLSVAALGGACIAVRLGWTPVAAWLSTTIGLEWLAAHVAAVVLLIGGSIALVVVVGTVVRRALKAAGLGLWDRLFGGVLGAAEGALVAALLLLLGIATLGRDHPVLAGTRSLAAFERLERLASKADLGPDVAAPPRR